MKLVPTDTNIVYRTKTYRSDLREYNRAPRVYVSLKDESILDNLINRRSRPTKLFREVATAALKEKGITTKKMTWSQFAGCSCPCSPGFILYDYDFEKGSIDSLRFDVFISAQEATNE